jgi:hypothetical protein
VFSSSGFSLTSKPSAESIEKSLEQHLERPLYRHYHRNLRRHRPWVHLDPSQVLVLPRRLLLERTLPRQDLLLLGTSKRQSFNIYSEGCFAQVIIPDRERTLLLNGDL